MRKRIAYWLAGAALAMALAFGLDIGGAAQPSIAYGADPTPTPTSLPDGWDPGGHGGGG